MGTQKHSLTPNGFIKTLSLLHLGLISSPVVLSGIIYFQTQSTSFDLSNTDDIYLMIVPIVSVICLFLGDFIFKHSVKNIPKTINLKQKLARFQTASIIKYALVEAPALFGVVAFMITENMAYLIVSLVLIFYFFMLKPTKEKIEKALGLNQEERNQFNKLNQPIP
ncbi:hypothetical protein DKG77_13770 [Flagellimonas aquimarina]|uniref:Uncharacterized protein n=1 Tax=Flagellimonas aquimarina TaxID=2201895 RepID=A0A316L0Y7_9FLAO|nr:hypothetical protein [Allomuricauda koreensis]PWL37833.1 hypothetical protein DKG77_13770 [Allomuricauda koreensis]